MDHNQTTMRNDITALRTDVDGLRDDILGLWTDVDTMRADMVTLGIDVTNHLHANDANASARLMNSTVTDAMAHLEPLRDSQNQPLANFPENYDASQNLSAQEVTNLLTQYNIPAYGAAAEKRKRLGSSLAY